MGYVRVVFWGVILLVVAGMLHYTLPRAQVLRVVETEVRRVEVGQNALFWGSSEPADASGNRDVKFVSTVTDDGAPRVFRNEDTGWGWPPYFKFDSADLQARASDAISDQTSPRWMLIHYYGIRSNLFSIYPNMLGLSTASGPNQTVIPWLRIGLFAGLVALVLTVRALLKRFWRRRIDPVVRDVSEAFGAADAAVDEQLSRSQTRFRNRRERLREWWIELVG